MSANGITHDDFDRPPSSDSGLPRPVNGTQDGDASSDIRACPLSVYRIAIFRHHAISTACTTPFRLHVRRHIHQISAVPLWTKDSKDSEEQLRVQVLPLCVCVCLWLSGAELACARHPSPLQQLQSPTTTPTLRSVTTTPAVLPRAQYFNYRWLRTCGQCLGPFYLSGRAPVCVGVWQVLIFTILFILFYLSKLQ